MSESERILKLNELFFDYVAYLIYMARQILTPGGYDHFALIKALEKVLEIQQMSGEIKGIKVFNDIRIELKTVESASSSEYETWKPFLDKLVQIIA
jgi:hypothetical protein